ncbi:metallophosphoesterase family protein [Nocardia sp. NBC_01327]|uniref:metallophosphoesterase family protein n=1 Tax=Nocardia sp. NBC_01327 TaxID=2903593 RepID=UPI002E0EA0BC|nr:DNA repair exonuclease [Nocardia sp. NBC_01327]
MIRLAHLADLHLGARLRAVPEYPGCPPIDPVQMAYDAFDALLRHILDGGYDGVLIAGDLFDRHEATSRAANTANAALADLHDAGIPVALIWGNHDAESPLPEQLRPPPSCWVAPIEAPGTHYWPDSGIVVHGRSIGDPDELRDLAADYPEPVDGWTNIGLLHTSLTGGDSRRPCAPTTLTTLTASGYDYWALGHVHRRLQLTDNPTVAYAGNPYPARKTEYGPRGFLEFRPAEPATAIPIDTTPVVREILTADTESDIWKRFADYLPNNRTTIWTLSGPPELLDSAREAARHYPGFAVADGRAKNMPG